MRHFLGTRGAAAFKISSTDNTPNAVSWLSLTSTAGNATTIGQQITGISSTINLKLNLTVGGIATASYGINSTNTVPASFTQVGSGTPLSGDTSTFTVSNNDWLFFRFTAHTQCIGTTVRVINTSDSNTQLNSFTVLFTPKGGCAP